MINLVIYLMISSYLVNYNKYYRYVNATPSYVLLKYIYMYTCIFVMKIKGYCYTHFCTIIVLYGKYYYKVRHQPVLDLVYDKVLQKHKRYLI